MGRLILVSGGIKSGKTKFAVELVKELPRLYIATARGTDPEMQARIMKHKYNRNKWDVWIDPLPSVSKLKNLLEVKLYSGCVLDCVGFYLANLMFFNIDAFEIIEFVKALNNHFKISVVVTNEVGMSLVPGTRLGRKFVDELGSVNTLLSDIADEFYFILSGQPLRLK